MATKKVTEYETVEKEREIKVCDYCELFTSEDIGDDEEFKEALLDFEIESTHLQSPNAFKMGIKMIMEADTRTEAEQVLGSLTEIRAEDTADLCPNCADQLFGDGPISMVRESTDLIDE